MIRRDLLFRVLEALVDGNDNNQEEVQTQTNGDDNGKPSEKGGSWDIFVDNDPDNYELPSCSGL